MVQIERSVYQTSRSGRIDCPLDHQARIIRGATPRFASQLSHKYAQLNARAVQTDLEQNHGRKVTRSYLQILAEWVGILATAKEETWEYALPRLDARITSVVVRLDGAMIPMADSAGYGEAMAGTLSFYDHAGERQQTLYLAAAPECGKQTFYRRLESEIARAKQHYPEARYRQIADGASSNWRFLERHRQRQLIDCFHATEYVGKLARARYPQRNAEAKRALWQQERCHQLKHDPDALDALVTEAARLSRRGALSQTLRDGAYGAWTYFNNHRHQIDYPGFLAEGLPIVSGVTEAASKTLVKERLCARACAGRPKAAISCSVYAPSPKPPDAGRSSGKRSISSGQSATVKVLLFKYMLGRPHPARPVIVISQRKIPNSSLKFAALE